MKLFLIAAALILPGTAAVAVSPSEGKSDDTERMICRTIGETGSRLSKRKLCMTAAEWAEHKRTTKEDIDKAQVTQINKGAQ